MPSMPRPTKRSSLACLTKKRLILLARDFELELPSGAPKADFIEALAQSQAASFTKLLEALPVAELRLICRSHELAVGGKKAALVARIAGSPESPGSAGEVEAQTSLLPEPKQADETEADLAAVFARAQPSIAGIVGLLDQRELANVLRRLAEQQGITIELAGVAGRDGLAAAIAQACELPVLLAELDREQLIRVAKHYALTPAANSREALLRSILAAATGLTEVEAREVEAEVEAEQAQAQAHSGELAREPHSSDAERYRAALEAIPRGVLHRVEANFEPGELPQPGELVRARQRQYLVSEVIPPRDTTPNSKSGLRPATLVKLVCLDDDAQGRELDVFWELEVGAERIDPTRQSLAEVGEFDPVPRFAAYYHALRWNCVTTATKPDDERVQAPFRAGIAVMQHQLVPLQKALALPRANLFIADDVGLGKTIEAGLILQELLLRQRLDFILIVCPASICLQWQAEMERRFGLRFEIVNREYVARIRRERGQATNPWDCGRRFIVSYQTLRRSEYQDKLRVALGARLPKSMLVLDEAHSVAPAGNAQRYAVDSQLTKLARGLAHRFENRLFLSATPHNGHSNSFSALLELLDPARFTRGVPVEGDRSALEAVMVRRLKRDLIGHSSLDFPVRRLIELRLSAEDDTWELTRAVAGEARPKLDPAVDLGPVHSHELALSELLREYEQLCAPSAARDKRVFIGLQKRLLSSCAAFERTLHKHLRSTGARLLAQLDSADTPESPDSVDSRQAPSDEIYGEELDGEVEQAVARAVLPADQTPRARAEAVLEQMQTLLRGAHSRPEGKLLGLLHWIRAHQCPAAGRQWFPTPEHASTAWSDTRLIVFTEYADTATYIIKMLRAAFAGTEREHDRVAYFHGAMSDDQRRELQANFNARPSAHPVRILVATDAAREGVNLQAHCADLIHYDIPWNPGRLEQRNGRIDRTLQPSPEVRCMYFAYPQRSEDRVLEVLVENVEKIHRQLGSLSAVILERIESTLETHGIDEQTQGRLDFDLQVDEELATAEREVEAVRPEGSGLRAQIEAAADCYERSREFFAPDADGLRETLSMALALAGAEDQGRFVVSEDSRDPAYPEETTHYRLPALPDDWARTLDTLRPPRPKDLRPWQWRAQTPPRPVVFEPLRRMTDDLVQLHLEHPLVRRALGRFMAQGYAAHDLRRATLVRYPGTHQRVVLIARLSLFGAKATRLHDGLLHLVAQIRSDGPAEPVEREHDQRDTLERMRAGLNVQGHWQPAQALVDKFLARLGDDLQLLWPRLEAEAIHEAEELTRRLDDRGAREAELLRETLQALDRKIAAALHTSGHASGHPSEHASEREAGPDQASQADPVARQRRLDRKHMQERRAQLKRELEREPASLRRHYAVTSRRIEAVGLVYLIPETR
ncbi:MAG: DISARM system SNF2-like helicase DrmD [Enhygromyxa sp.]